MDKNFIFLRITRSISLIFLVFFLVIIFDFSVEARIRQAAADYGLEFDVGNTNSHDAYMVVYFLNSAGQEISHLTENHLAGGPGCFPNGTCFVKVKVYTDGNVLSDESIIYIEGETVEITQDILADGQIFAVNADSNYQNCVIYVSIVLAEPSANADRETEAIGLAVYNHVAAQLNNVFDSSSSNLLIDGVNTHNVFSRFSSQGPLCDIAFDQALMPGYFRAFTFNILVDDISDYSLKSGTMKLKIPDSYKKPGRQFMLYGIDDRGVVHIFKPLNYDTDNYDPDNLCFSININGYAFMLAYKD